MPSAGFEPAIPVTKRPMTYALDGAATGFGKQKNILYIIFKYSVPNSKKTQRVFVTKISWLMVYKQ
jgi:hypothetical protein